MAEPMKIINNPSITTDVFEYDEVGRVSAIAGKPLASEGGGTIEKSDLMWKPTVGSDGYVRWSLASSATTPDDAYISGAQGPAGQDGDDGYSITLQSVTDEDGGKKVTLAWGETPETSSFVIPSGAKGIDGQNGENGTSVVVKSMREFNDVVGTHTKGGTEITLEWNEGQTVKTSAFSAFNGEKGQDGAGSTYTFDANTLSGDGVTADIGVNTNVIATQAWVGDQNYLTSVPSEYITDTELADYHYITSSDLVEKAKSAWIDENTTSSFAQIKDSIDWGNAIAASYQTHSGDYVTSANNSFPNNGQYGIIKDTNGIQWGEITAGTTLTLPVNIGSNNTITGNTLGAIGNKNIVGEKSMALSIVGSSAIGNSFAFGDENYTSANSLVAGWKSSATDFSIAVGFNNVANLNSVAFARDNSAYNYSFAAGHANTAINYSMAYGRGLAIEGTTDGTTGFGGLALGGWNKTSANAILVLGNGTANTRSDAVVVDSTGNTHMYRPMSVEYANGQNVLAVASAATLIGASRQTSANFGQNTTALGTTWLGVGDVGMYRGFLKYTQGGNVGDLNTNNTMQVEFTPSNKGQIFAKAKNNGTDCPETQILNPTKASCDAMTTSGIDASNMSGPNYMIAKNADGQFVVGAAVFNCQGSLPGTLQPNTYYFVY